MTDEPQALQLPPDGPSFVKRLMPSAIVAIGGTEVVAYLQLDGPRKVKPEMRTSVIDSMLAREQGGNLSPQGHDKLRRAMLNIANNVNADDPAWGSLSMVRGTVTLSLWQTALEYAATLGGQILCTQENDESCDHDRIGFAAKWKHFIGALSRLNSAAAEQVLELYQTAEATIDLRHRLVHGNATGRDGVHLERTEPTELNQPISDMRDGIIRSVLTTVFDDDAPGVTIHRAHFEVLGIPQSILHEVLGAATLEAAS